MEDQNNPVNSTDKELRKLIEWMLDSISIRDLIISLIEKKEENDDNWLDAIELELHKKKNKGGA